MARSNSNGTNGPNNPTPDVREILMAQIAADEESIAPVEAQIAETRERIRRARAALAALDGDVTRTPQTAQTRTRTRAAGSSVTVDDSAILAFIQGQTEPVGAIDIAKSLGMDKVPPALSNRLKTLTEAGSLKRTGEKRGTRYAAA